MAKSTTKQLTKLQFVMTNDETAPTAVEMRRAKNESGLPANAVIVTFDDDTEARVSLKHFDEGDPVFLNEANQLITSKFELRANSDTKQLWIYAKGGGGKLS